MRSFLTSVIASFAVAALGGCTAHRDPAVAAHPNVIVIQEFAASSGAVTLDPSLGFSLYRGTAGVPPRQRAQSISRAAAFSLADATAQELARLGYDVMHVEAGTAAPAGRALVVNGRFLRIFEGHRHENASVEVRGEIGYRAAGAAPQRLSAFTMDSRRLPNTGLVPAPGRHGTDVNYEATRIGAAIGRYVAAVARANRWPGAGG